MSMAMVGSRVPCDRTIPCPPELQRRRIIAGMGTSPAAQTSYYNKWSEVCKIS